MQAQPAPPVYRFGIGDAVPIEQLTEFDLVIPEAFLLRANEVIE